MLKRLYIDNYKCLVGFELRPRQVQLLVGMNGSGKSSVLEVLAKLRDFIARGRLAGEVFPPATLTRWQAGKTQSFELDLEARDAGQFHYELTLIQASEEEAVRVGTERLESGGRTLYAFAEGQAELYADGGALIARHPARDLRSGVTDIPERDDTHDSVRFRYLVGRILTFVVNPWTMAASTKGEIDVPSNDLRDFASWYQSLVQDAPDRLPALFEDLRRVVGGFAGMKLVKSGAAGTGRRVLQVDVAAPDDGSRDNRIVSFGLDELSDGERVLIVLYTLLHSLVWPDITVCLDEPANFLALREIQPWLVTLRDRADERGFQVLICSHNPEVIDYLAPDGAIWFDRDAGGPARAGGPPAGDSGGLKLSELIARGWVDAET